MAKWKFDIFWHTFGHSKKIAGFDQQATLFDILANGTYDATPEYGESGYKYYVSGTSYVEITDWYPVAGTVNYIVVVVDGVPLFEIQFNNDYKFDVQTLVAAVENYKNGSPEALKQLFNRSSAHDTGRDDDIVYGSDFNDEITEEYGSLSSRDVFYGGGGNDVLSSEKGKDHLYGGDGDDVLEGGPGTDWVTGGSGKDVFFLNYWNGLTRISDFERNEDKLFVFQIDDAKMGKIEKDNFVRGSKARDIDDFYIYDRKNGKFYIDLDGSKDPHNARLVAILEDKPKLKLSDIVVHDFGFPLDYWETIV